MAESQSRYGIMEELNNRKITQKEKLANLEKETDQKVYDSELEIEKSLEDIKNEEQTYKIKFKQRQRQRQVNLSMIQNDFNRAKETLETEMKDDEDNYEGDFKKWKEQQEGFIKIKKEKLKRYLEIQNKKIKDKQNIILEIDNGIKSLKEMSAEQNTGE